MRITALSACLLLLSVPAFAASADAGTPYAQLAKLASFLSAGDAEGALESFDKSAPHYGEIAQDIQAFAAQAEVLCSIDPVSDTEAPGGPVGVHRLDLDWYMTLHSRADEALIEKRRLRVAVTMRLFETKSGGRWRITSLSPIRIFAPIAIR